ncbi:hypothetical protein [Arthrobacter sp. USHLN218]
MSSPDTPQQEYQARPDHSLKDIMWIHSLGIAVPGDGDRFTKQTKETK